MIRDFDEKEFLLDKACTGQLLTSVLATQSVGRD